jgi:hypothetical protein
MRDWILLLVVVTAVGCGTFHNSRENSQALTPARRAAVEEDVRRFALNVAHDVTQDGPIAWRKHFSDSPSFFMAVNGKLALSSGQAAAQAIPEIARTYKHIELRWGDDLRVDVLTPELAVMAASWNEVVDLADGKRLVESGYFTGVVENRNGQWQFRDAHWSAPVPAATTPISPRTHSVPTIAGESTP